MLCHSIAIISLIVMPCGSLARAQDKPTVDDVATIATHGLALFTCAAYAASTTSEKAKVDGLFTRGVAEFRRFIETMKANKDLPFAKAVNDKVPMIVGFNLGGPSTDFMIGRLWAAADLYVEDNLYDRETWTHQKTDPKADAPTKELIALEAGTKFREKNCALL